MFSRYAPGLIIRGGSRIFFLRKFLFWVHFVVTLYLNFLVLFWRLALPRCTSSLYVISATRLQPPWVRHWFDKPLKLKLSSQKSVFNKPTMIFKTQNWQFGSIWAPYLIKLSKLTTPFWLVYFKCESYGSIYYLYLKILMINIFPFWKTISLFYYKYEISSYFPHSK